MENYTDINARTIDQWVDNGWEWSVPISHETYADAKNGKWDVVLTPIRPVPHEWFSPYLVNGRLEGVNLLGLASGGGQQMQIFAALGAECTVMDYSQRQLDREHELAKREGYAIQIVRGDMTKRFLFADAQFDVIFRKRQIVHHLENCTWL